MSRRRSRIGIGLLAIPVLLACGLTLLHCSGDCNKCCACRCSGSGCTVWATIERESGCMNDCEAECRELCIREHCPYSNASRCEDLTVSDGGIDGGADGGADGGEVEPLECPEGMAPIEERFCMDIYEASRPDADETGQGSDSSRATSRPGVMPWLVGSDNAAAQAACTAAGKGLCTEQEWLTVCEGPARHAYAYGDEYDPVACNGIDKFCSCEQDSPCAAHEPCPYPGCYWDCRPQTAFHLEPTGSSPDCTNAFGVYDLSGNLWEHVKDGDGTRVRGGAFNSDDSQEQHQCDTVPGDWTPSAIGFRCCWRPE
ncbi:MAG: SUMF1/EgtB/PvdO family nonheme iron enzyme [Deltaproteobacteria bacterium]|nr:SUMF1/EgtB/PvdO family nonheme iron enzyme [Deltaproteobacteria bacterium]